jgi:tetratricopeptide (TPR) repeat protein
MWNFSGRQNDIQGLTGNVTDGNWISGIPFIDNPRLGDQSKLPQSLAKNKGRNIYYMLPLLLGVLGIVYQYKKNKNDSLVILLLFLFTGIAINTYLNVPPFQPRERDYAYVGSYYAFAIWIGLGVLYLYEIFNKKISPNISAIAATVLCLVFVPGIMAKENWDDHDRSHRYTARDFAKNYLDSCAPNAILFTNGDNDTFPLWYVQEVEGYRTDVRVVNLSLLQTDWYIDQMKRKAYDSDPVPFSLSEDKYRQGTRDYVPIYDRGLPGYVNIREIVDFIANDNPQAKLQMQSGTSINYIPTSKIKIPVDSAKVISNGTVPAELADKIVPAIEFEINKSYILKNELMILDLLATNNWERPVYFAITTGSDSYLNLEPYFQLEGLAYRLVPVKNNDSNGQTGRVNSTIMYENLMNKFKWGGIDNPNVYLDENNLRMTMNFRNNFYRLADALINEGQKDKALEVLDKAMAVMPETTVPFNYFVLPIAEGYYKLKQVEKANEIVTRIREIYIDNLSFYANLESNHIRLNLRDTEQAMQILRQLLFQLQAFEQTEELNKLKEQIKTLPAGKSNEYRELYSKYFAII